MRRGPSPNHDPRLRARRLIDMIKTINRLGHKIDLAMVKEYYLLFHIINTSVRLKIYSFASFEA